jgi:[lysine-biosynthesis-protein LysW]---L-2-aminoadipate ligase
MNAVPARHGAMTAPVASAGAPQVRITTDSRESRPRQSRAEEHSIFIFGKETETNWALAAAFAEFGHRARLVDADVPPRPREGDIALGRIDVLPTLDGIETGLWQLARLERQGAQVLNTPLALFAAHDKLSTALFLGRAGVAQPRTSHVRDVSLPSFPPPYVVKPRFGSWGRDVVLARDEDELRAQLERFRLRQWFLRHGALVQSLVEPTGRDLRIVVAAGRIVGAIERIALPGEWRTNISLGGVRRRVSPPLAAQELALRAVAALGIDLAGVDIVADEAGRLYVLEVNGAVDFTADYGPDVFTSAATALLERAAARSRSLSVVDDPKAEAGSRPDLTNVDLLKPRMPRAEVFEENG